MHFPPLHIVAHGDLDGIVSAVQVARACRNFPWLAEEKSRLLNVMLRGPVRTTFVQPFELDKVIINDDEQVVVVDIAVNNRDPQTTVDFIRRLGLNLDWWFDHHQGWENVLGEVANPEKFAVNPDYSSCASLIVSLTEAPERESEVSDAEASDTRRGSLSPKGEMVEAAIKADLKDDSIREAAFWWLLGDESQLPILEEAAERYASVQEETSRLAAGFRVTGQVAVVEAGEGSGQFDLTQLLLAGQNLAPFAVVVSEGRLTVATKSGVNLVDAFGLPSGAPFRVTLPAERLEEVLEKLS